MADGSVTIKVDMDGSNAQSGIGKLKTLLGGVENAGSKVGSVFKSVLGANLVSNALISGIQQLGSSIKNVFSSAIDEGAKLEQSIGGVETLFKDSADKVKGYADQAFRTAGLSANEYMENVTSFSASLLQSLGGDTEKAADVANRAMIDMSDNANKMGTNMGLIQNAYQGFAKDNYTMLDNLKLGYGGTKSEMQRLIKDTAAMTDIQKELNVEVKDGDMSFGNMVNAISVMQKHLGIAGTTAKEAATTFSGSFASMKASWTDLLGKIALGKDIELALKNLVSTTSTFLLGNFIPMIGNVVKQLPKAISGALAEAGPQIEKSLKSLFSNIGLDTGIFDVVKDTFRDIIVTFETLFSTLTNKANGFGKVFEGVGNIIKLVNFIIQDLARSFQFALEAFAKTGAINNIYKTFLKLTEAALDLSEKLADAIPWDIVGEAAGNIVNAISMVVSWIAKFSKSISGDVWRGLVTGIGGVLIAFKAFNFLKSFNPFSLFKRNVASGVGGVTSIVKSASNVIVSIIRSLGQSVAVAARGIGNGLKSVFQGIGQALSVANPVNILALSVAILAIGSAMAIAGTQGDGIKTILEGLGDAVSKVASVIIGALANAIKTVAPALSTLSPLVIAVGQAFALVVTAFGKVAPQIAVLVSAISSGVAQIITALAPIVQIIGTVITSIAQIIADAVVKIVQIMVENAPQMVNIISAITAAIQASAPILIALINGIVTAIQALAPVLSDIVNGIVSIVQQLAPILTAALNGIATVIESVGTAISSAAQGIGQGIQSALEGVASVITSIGQVIGTALNGIANIIQSVGQSISTAARGIGKGIESAFNGISNVITAVGNSIKSVLDGLANVFNSIGNAALKAGQGFKALAQGVVMITNTNLGDMAASLAAVATGIGAIAAVSGGMASVGLGMKSLGQGLVLVQSSGSGAVTALKSISSAVPTISSSISNLGPAMSTTSAAMSTFASSVASSFAGLIGSTASIAVMQSRLTALNASMTMAQSGASAMSIGFSVVSSVISTLSGLLSSVPGKLSLIATSFSTISSTATSSMNSLNSAVRSAMTQAVSTMRSSMQQMVSVVRQSATQMTQAGQQAGRGVSNGVTTGIISGIGSATSAMRSMTSAIYSTALSGVGVMVSVGAQIANGLAQGMYSALGAVTAAANALVAEAERAAQAKAKIHSPSRLFRDNVGRYIAQGIAVGIEKNTSDVTDSLAYVQKEMSAFKFGAEELLGLGNNSLSSQFKLKSITERAEMSRIEVVREKADQTITRALEVAEEAVKRPVNVLLDDGTLVAKIGNPMTSYQNEKIKIDNMMRGII